MGLSYLKKYGTPTHGANDQNQIVRKFKGSKAFINK